MSIPLGKALSLFQQSVNTKVEPVLQYDWIHKLNSKKKLDERFLVATHAGLYFSKAYILNIIKISRKYAWIDLASIEVQPEMNFAVFTFRVEQNPTIEMYHNDIIVFLQPIFSYLIEFLPNHHPAFGKLPQFFERKPVKISSYIVNMYVSACHSLSIEPEHPVLYYLDDFKQSQKPLEVDKKKFSENSLKALLTALTYSKSVTNIKFYGTGFPSLWSALSTIISRSAQFFHITIANYKKDLNFDQFCDSVRSCTLQSLEFENIVFTDKMAEMLSNTVQESLINKLVFNDCNFNDATAPTLFMESGSYAGVKLFSVTNDKSIKMDDVFIPKFINFVIHAGITELEISNCDIEISKVFNIISTTQIPLSLLNLSGNYCSDDYQGNISFPETLYTFDLKNIKWIGNSLSTFLLSTPFSTAVEISLSQARLESENLEDLYHNLSTAPQNAMIVKLEWNRIDINNEFLMYILTLPCLRDLSICHCHVSDESLRLSLLSDIIWKLPLERLSLRRTFRNEHGLLRELRQSLISSKTLQSLDVSDLAIGDVGIAILQDVVSNSSSLSSINFDKSDGMDVGVLIDMFNTLAAIPRITKVTKPRHDIQVISSEHSRKTAQEIRSAWGRLSSAMKKRSRNDDESTEFDPESSIAANSQSSASPAKLNIPRANTTNVSWNVDGEPQVPNMATEWEAMKSRFSYPNLTGLPVISIPDNLNFSL